MWESGIFFFQAEEGIRGLVRFRGPGDGYRGQFQWSESPMPTGLYPQPDARAPRLTISSKPLLSITSGGQVIESSRKATRLGMHWHVSFLTYASTIINLAIRHLHTIMVQ